MRRAPLLLKGRPRADLAGLIDAYRLLATAKSSYVGHGGGSSIPSQTKIMAGVSLSVLSFFDRERDFALTREFSDGFSAFKGTSGAFRTRAQITRPTRSLSRCLPRAC